MRVHRRLVFAAPFVVVVACKKPVAEPREPDDEDEGEDESAEVLRPRVAASEPPPDAAVVDSAVVDAAPPPDAPLRQSRREPLCGEHGMTCNPPRPMKAVVTNVTVEGSGTIVVVNRGADDGVGKDWNVCFVRTRDDDRCRNEGGLVLIRVDKNKTKLRSTLTYDQIERFPYVKLWAP